ncbi:YgcG family protein [Ornithinimicrobium sp. INDO-MA30-4]|uniref:TPM domain-containing protein n=1 Tax=Ornithinimicrobium sp. INDO-MA30-4 TaxID=2908651 RepID=UPI001F351912|nr:TPM domain-containing protein [Ornithinimicrobium sp. INDO-MA30-4]UJH70594.1 TPM domain-containing protein [Ornithinimicrobium sp. INDO-MA30-4]
MSVVVAAPVLVPESMLSAAHAEDPLDLPDQIYDPADALSDSDEAEALAAIQELDDDTNQQLFVAYVDSFDGLSGADWAQQTYDTSGMGGNDLLMAVAVDDRRYGSAASTTGQQDADSVATVEADFIEPQLADDDWLGAVVEASQGYADVSAGDTSSSSNSSSSSDSSGFGSFFGFGAFFLLPLIFGFAFTVIKWVANLFSGKSTSKSGRTTTYTGGPRPAPSEKATAAGVPTQELQRMAAESLVSLDNAIRSATDELAFAQAQFGDQRTSRFGEILVSTRAKAQEAFRIRQELDDTDKEPEPVERTMLAQIIDISKAAKNELDSHAQEFADLRSLEDRAPALLAALTTQIAEVNDRLPSADQQIRGLEARFSPAALRTVHEHRAQLDGLLDSASGFVEAGQASLANDRSAAVAATRAAEESVGLAVRLLDQISGAGDDLANAKEALSIAIASISSDIQDASRLAPNDSTVQAAVVEARAAIEQGQQSTRDGDPLAGLARLDAAEHDLDTVLEPMRKHEADTTKNREAFDSRLTRVSARLHSIDSTINAHRGAANSTARTRISEALRLLDQAQKTVSSDSLAASSLLNQAEQLGERAFQNVQSDTDRWDGPTGGGFNRGPRRGGRNQGINLESLILGGILGSSGRHSGGWGGGGGRSSGGFGGGGSLVGAAASAEEAAASAAAGASNPAPKDN